MNFDNFYLLANNKLIVERPYFHFGDIIDIEYSLNNFGYRSPDFNKEDKNVLLALGCSHTYGIGLPKEYTWPYLLSKEIGAKESTLGIPGHSAMGQVRKAFAYFKEIGHPEFVVGFFPIKRMQAPLVYNKFQSVHSLKHKDISFEHDNLRIEDLIIEEDVPKYSKFPHISNEIIPSEMAIFLSYSFIFMLEQYCKANNIKFLWSVWDNGRTDYMNTMKKSIDEYNPDFHKNFIARDIGDNGYDCHIHHKDNPLFLLAADRSGGPNSGHMGMHQHIHIAESFLKEINKRNDLKLWDR